MSTNSTKTVKGRISNKHGTEEYWILSVYTDTSKTTLRENPFYPLAGELIVYDPDSVYDYPRFKFGNGISNVDQLPFVTEELTEEMANKFSLTYFSVGSSADGVTMQDLYNKITEEIGDGTWSFILISARNSFTGFLKMRYRGGYYEIKAFDPVEFKTFDGGGILSSVYIEDFIGDDVASSLGTWKAAATQDWVTGQGYTTNTGTVTSIATGTGLSGGTITTSGTISLANATERTVADTGTHHLTYRDSGTGAMGYDSSIFIGGVLGELNATTFKVNQKSTIKYNTTEGCLEFTFV